MRIIAGEARGRTLLVPKGMATRPTADRVREAIFSVLAPRICDSRVLDVFAGTGALGLEALSRGAAAACFIEKAQPALRVLHQNVANLGLAGARILAGDCLSIIPQLGPAFGEAPFDLVFLDPPYNKGFLAKTLTCLAAADILNNDARIVVETKADMTEMQALTGWEPIKISKYGDTAVIYFAFERSAFCGQS